MSAYGTVRIGTRFVDRHRLAAGLANAGYNTVVHHKDGNPRNNAPDNLEVMTRAEHTRLHNRMRANPAVGRK